MIDVGLVHVLLNSSVAGRFEWYLNLVIFQIILVIDGWESYNIRWLSLDLTDDKSSLIQAVACWRQATTITWANADPVLCHNQARIS